jgi:hypothetical protein
MSPWNNGTSRWLDVGMFDFFLIFDWISLKLLRCLYFLGFSCLGSKLILHFVSPHKVISCYLTYLAFGMTSIGHELNHDVHESSLNNARLLKELGFGAPPCLHKHSFRWNLTVARIGR